MKSAAKVEAVTMAYEKAWPVAAGINMKLLSIIRDFGVVEASYGASEIFPLVISRRGR